MNLSEEALFKGVLASDRRAVARAISLIENGRPKADGLSRSLFKHTGKAYVVGVTGAPGAGKSTLVDRLAVAFRSAGKRVAILAIDPTSPFSGGAILGDRIRMARTAEDRDIFIRSMATRGALGGLSRATFETIAVLDAAGYDVVLLETVGVGQVEVDVVRMVDTCLVVLVPGMGDAVQTFKAGILEIADLFVINKADREGADLLHRDLRLLVSLAERGEGRWEPPILRTTATTGEGTGDLVEGIGKHQEWLRSSPEGRLRRENVTEATIVKLVSDKVLARLLSLRGEKFRRDVVECAERRQDPYAVVDELVSTILPERAP